MVGCRHIVGLNLLKIRLLDYGTCIVLDLETVNARGSRFAGSWRFWKGEVVFNELCYLGIRKCSILVNVFPFFFPTTGGGAHAELEEVEIAGFSASINT